MSTPSAPARPISTVAITGGTGFVGSAIVSELLHKGYRVRALVRTNESRTVLPTHSNITRVVGDITDAASLNELVAGTHACIHLVGIIREKRREAQTFQRMHVDATRAVVHACEHANVRRYVHMSALGVRADGVSDYQRTKFEAETLVRRSALEWTIFRPSLIHGKDSEFVAMARKWMTMHAPPFLFLPYFSGGIEDYRVPLGGVTPTAPRVAPVYVGDVAKSFVDCLPNPRTIHEVYDLCGPDVMTWPQMLKTMRLNTPGALPLSPFGVPSGLAALKAKAAAIVGLGELLPFDEGQARMGAEDNVSSMAKTNDDFAISWQRFEPTYKAYAAI